MIKIKTKITLGKLQKKLELNNLKISEEIIQVASTIIKDKK